MRGTTGRALLSGRLRLLAGGALCFAVTLLLGAVFSANVFAATGVTRFEQTDKALSYAGSWSTYSTASASSGSYKRASTDGASVTMAFDGTSLTWIATKGIYQGRAKVYVDGKAPVIVDLAADTATYQARVFSTGTLADGYHLVKIVWYEGSDPAKYVNIDAVEVAGTLVAPTRVEQTSSGVTCNSTWFTGSSSYYSGGSIKYTKTSGSSVTFQFKGIQASLVAKEAATYGKAAISVDGGTPQLVDLYSAKALYKQTVWSSGWLPFGTHSVKIEWTGQKQDAATSTYINIDAVDVIGSVVGAEPEVTATSIDETVYYVDASGGNDGNDGHSPSTAWKTLAKVTAAYFKPGDKVLFKRGQVWRERFYLYTGRSNGAAGSPITFDAYGTGAKPVFMGSKDLSSTSRWTYRGGNIWRATGLPTDIGNMIMNNEAVFGHKESSISGVNVQGDFYYSPTGDYMDMYSVGNPGSYYSHIEAAQKLSTERGNGGNAVGGDHKYLTFRNIAIKYQGWTGLTLGPGASNIIVELCDFSWCGGSYMYEGGGGRDGNGIMTSNTQREITIRNNTFKNIYMVSISLQSYGSTKQYIDGVYVYGNLVSTTRGSGAELYVDPAQTGTVPTDVYFVNNTFDNIGGSRLNETAQVSKSIRINESAKPSNCHILNNIFRGSTGWYVYAYGTALAGWEIDYNCYYVNKGNAFMGPDGTSRTLYSWQVYSAKDTHSFALNPEFVSSTDFRLQSDSPCRGTGLAVPAVVQPSDPNIGAY